jgi:hypothetical protein
MDLAWLEQFLRDWTIQYPVESVGFVVAFALARWGLSRKNPVLREGERVFQELAIRNRGRYDALRPLA